jgi:hypothetical protein
MQVVGNIGTFERPEYGKGFGIRLRLNLVRLHFGCVGVKLQPCRGILDTLGRASDSLTDSKLGQILDDIHVFCFEFVNKVSAFEILKRVNNIEDCQLGRRLNA